jgi:redox-sensitive bicupin YhaK (pirin superfamily)
LKPNYGSFAGNEEMRTNRWAHLVSDVNAGDIKTPIKINQDANILVSELSQGAEPVVYELQSGRQAYMVCVEGKVSVSTTDNREIALERHDAAEIVGPATITVKVDRDATSSAGESSESISQHSSAAHLLMVEMAKAGYGRSDL